MTEETPTYTVKTVTGQDYTGEGLIRHTFEGSGIVATHNGEDVWIPHTNIESVHGELGEIEEVYEILDVPEDEADEADEAKEPKESLTFRDAVASGTIEQEFTIDELSDLTVADEELLQEAIEVDSRKGAVSVYEDLLENLNE